MAAPLFPSPAASSAPRRVPHDTESSDLAASQQLIDEQAHSRVDDAQPEGKKKRKRRMRKSKDGDAPSSSIALSTVPAWSIPNSDLGAVRQPTPTGTQLINDSIQNWPVSSSADAEIPNSGPNRGVGIVEIPDSQAVPAVNGNRSSPSGTRNPQEPFSNSKTRDTGHGLAQQLEDAVKGSQEQSPLGAKKQRKSRKVRNRPASQADMANSADYEEPLLASTLLKTIKARKRVSLDAREVGAGEADAGEHDAGEHDAGEVHASAGADDAVQDVSMDDVPEPELEPNPEPPSPAKTTRRKRPKVEEVSDNEAASPPKKKTKKRGKAKEPESTSRIAQTQDTHTNGSQNGKMKWFREAAGPDDATPAEKELANIRILNVPADLRDSGEFSQDEEEMIRRAVREFQDIHQLEVGDLVRLIQFTIPKKSDAEMVNGRVIRDMDQINASRAFWTELYSQLERRKTTGIQRWVRRRYTLYKGAGQWSEHEDIYLKELFALYPHQWKRIGAEMGDRPSDACRDRWRNYLQYGDKRNINRWSDYEEGLLINAVAEVMGRSAEARVEDGLPPLNAYSSKDINWAAVTEIMNGTRSRLQCLQKWNSLQERDRPEQSPESERKRTKKSRKATSEEPQPPKSGRKRKNRADQDSDEDATAELSTTSRKRTRKYPKKEDMLWGDKLQLIEEIIECAPETEADIDWRSIHLKWSIKDQKAVLNEMLEAVGEHSDFRQALGAIMEWIAENYADDISYKYDPGQDGEGSVGTPKPNHRNLSKPGQRKSNYFVTESDDGD